MRARWRDLIIVDNFHVHLVLIRIFYLKVTFGTTKWNIFVIIDTISKNIHRILSNNALILYYFFPIDPSFLVIGRRNPVVFDDDVLKQMTHVHLTIDAAGAKIYGIIVMPFNVWANI